jgi:hypothetical protein
VLLTCCDYMKFREIYCNNCKKMLGRYNIKFYDNDKIVEILKSRHSLHVKKGHQVIIRDFIKKV